MIGGHRGDGFARVSDHLVREHRLVGSVEAVVQLAGHVISGDDRRNAGDPPLGSAAFFGFGCG